MSYYFGRYFLLSGMEYLKHTNLLKRLGERIRLIRVRKLISQEELSFKTEISRNQIGRVERGEINTGISTLYEIAKGLDVELEELFKN